MRTRISRELSDVWVNVLCIVRPVPKDRVPAFSNKEAFRVVETELGVPFEDVYELMEPEPIAAASIGQVGTIAKGIPPVNVVELLRSPRCACVSRAVVVQPTVLRLQIWDLSE